MLDGITYEELIEWFQFLALEPHGERRADVHAALICTVLANIHRDPKREALTIQDFMLFEEKSEDDDIVSPKTKAWLYAMAARTKENGE